ncbi:hypothetical protein [Microbacterium sediminis]|uniref:hypothetical protein n=1 Tax=Microbacterium sediminis TaxID=904291 RepID=UPI001072235F|nr:hypothetical protein [Microbacterium sediminis]QBR73300.1 hypothetical protein E3O41_01830 [Microbacterium sediminis]
MPIVMPEAGLRSSVGTQISQALELRRRGRALLDDADSALNDLINPERQRIDTTVWQSVPVSEVLSGRRRLEAQYQRSEVRDVERLVASNAKKVVRLADVTESVRLENRFKGRVRLSGGLSLRCDDQLSLV